MIETGRLRPNALVTTFPIAGIKYHDQTFRKKEFLLSHNLGVQPMCLGKHRGRNLRRMVTLYLSTGEQGVGGGGG